MLCYKSWASNGLGGTLREQQLIRLNLQIVSFPPRMVALLQELQPDLAEDSDQEIELDIDALDAKVLWRLQEYVNSLNMMGPVAKPAGEITLTDRASWACSQASTQVPAG